MLSSALQHFLRLTQHQIIQLTWLGILCHSRAKVLLAVLFRSALKHSKQLNTSTNFNIDKNIFKKYKNRQMSIKALLIVWIFHPLNPTNSKIGRNDTENWLYLSIFLAFYRQFFQC